MARMVKSLLCKYEELSSVPQHSYKNLGVVVCTCNPSAGETDERILGACWLLAALVGYRVIEKPVSEKIRWRAGSVA